MLTRIFNLLNKIAYHLNLDLLWRVCRFLPASDGLKLGYGILASEEKQDGPTFSILLDLLQRREVEKITFHRNGTVWNAPAWDINITLHLLTDGGYQQPEMKMVIAWLQQHGYFAGKNTIVDLGANIGTTCIPLAQQTGCKIIAVEPVPENYNLLQENVRQNGLQGEIICVRKAISNEPGVADMVLPDLNCGGAFMKDALREAKFLQGIERRNVMSVETDTLMNILQSNKVEPAQIAFVWCDVEGCETSVTATGKPLWSAGIPLFIEVFPGMLERQTELGTFISTMEACFDSFIDRVELVKDTIKTKPRPISEFGALVESLAAKDAGTDVLLIPKRAVQGA